MNNFNDPLEAEEATLNKKTELPLIWLLPVIAFLVSGWLVYKAVSEKGPEITIDFPTAEGLEVDKTKIKAAYEKRAKAKIKNIELLRIAISLMARKEGVE